MQPDEDCIQDQHTRARDQSGDQPPGAAASPDPGHTAVGPPEAEAPAPAEAAPVEAAPVEAAPVAAALETLAERLGLVEAQLGEHHRRAAHREAVIDRLHADNQTLLAGLRRQLMEPLVQDLIRLHDGLTREAARYGPGAAGEGDPVASLLASFATDVELSLGRCGLDVYTAEPGDAYVPGEHQPVGVVRTDDPEAHNRIAEVLTAGFRDRETGRVRRQLRARFLQRSDPADGQGPAAERQAGAAQAPADAPPD
jgi:molecular chaperone GrpE